MPALEKIGLVIVSHKCLIFQYSFSPKQPFDMGWWVFFAFIELPQKTYPGPIRSRHLAESYTACNAYTRLKTSLRSGAIDEWLCCAVY